MAEKGPIYGVELIDSLPFGVGPMRQAMPSRDDLKMVAKVNERTVAGYEILLDHYRFALAAVEGLTKQLADTKAMYEDALANYRG